MAYVDMEPLLPLNQKRDQISDDIQYGYGYEGKSKKRLPDRLFSWFRDILRNQDSRNLFFFLILNLSFAFVELFYGVWTNSLGLISDSFHMFFDCTGLVAGLIASVIAGWSPNSNFSYGYKRAEVLAGFLNGLFLLFIAFFILSEAVERLLEPPEVKHERLFVVSVLGFLVNLVGIYVFQHGGAHGHSHGGGGHGHSHSHKKEDDHHSHNNWGNDSHGHSHGGDGMINFLGGHGHSHDNHGHSHNGSNHFHSHSDDSGGSSLIMSGVFLHILADTLGSVGVIISAGLMWAFEWYIADPICSICIAVLICLSVMGLIKDSGSILMQRTPAGLENQIQSCCQRISNLDGVVSYQDVHFWTLSSNVFIGTITLEVARNADPRYITNMVQKTFKDIGIKKVTVQLDYQLT